MCRRLYPQLITLDRKASGGARLIVDNGSEFTQNKEGKVVLTFEVDGATEMMVSNTNDFKGAVWQPYSKTLGWKLSGEDGLKVVGAKFKDKAGNETPVVTGKIKLARSVSVSGGVKINNDSAITKNVNKRVDLDLRAQGAKDMMIANNADFLEGKWEEYKTEKVWTLPGDDGEKTVFVKFRASIGIESTVYSDKIILDRAGPTAGKLLIILDSLNKKKKPKCKTGNRSHGCNRDDDFQQSDFSGCEMGAVQGQSNMAAG